MYYIKTLSTNETVWSFFKDVAFLKIFPNCFIKTKAYGKLHHWISCGTSLAIKFSAQGSAL
jgi:hypothetical protein